MADKFISSISVAYKDRSKGLILAGQPFEQEDISPEGFESLKSGGYISCEGQVVTSAAPKGRVLVSRPEIDAPPADDSKGPRNLVKGLKTQEEIDQEKADKALKTKNEKALKKAKADSVFNGDPAELAQMEMPVLLGAYQDICEKYGMVAEKYSSKEEVIAVLSSQFVKS